VNKPKSTRCGSQKSAVEGEWNYFHNRMEPNQASNWWQIHLATSISQLTRFSVPLHLRPHSQHDTIFPTSIVLGFLHSVTRLGIHQMPQTLCWRCCTHSYQPQTKASHARGLLPVLRCCALRFSGGLYFNLSVLLQYLLDLDVLKYPHFQNSILVA
jgi:hypothetical protein